MRRALGACVKSRQAGLGRGRSRSGVWWVALAAKKDQRAGRGGCRSAPDRAHPPRSRERGVPRMQKVGGLQHGHDSWKVLLLRRLQFVLAGFFVRTYIKRTCTVQPGTVQKGSAAAQEAEVEEGSIEGCFVLPVSTPTASPPVRAPAPPPPCRRPVPPSRPAPRTGRTVAPGRPTDPAAAAAVAPSRLPMTRPRSVPLPARGASPPPTCPLPSPPAAAAAWPSGGSSCASSPTRPT